MFCIWEAGSRVHLENKICKNVKEFLEKESMYTWKRGEQRKKREFDLPNTKAYSNVKIVKSIMLYWTKKEQTDEVM